jgi:hypothetical protein
MRMMETMSSMKNVPLGSRNMPAVVMVVPDLGVYLVDGVMGVATP